MVDQEEGTPYFFNERPLVRIVRIVRIVRRVRIVRIVRIVMMDWPQIHVFLVH